MSARGRAGGSSAAPGFVAVVILTSQIFSPGCGPSGGAAPTENASASPSDGGIAERRADALRSARRAEGQGQWIAAEKAWREVRSLDPGNGAALYALARLRRAAGDDASSLRLLDELETIEPGAARGPLLRADLLLDPIRQGTPADVAAAEVAARRGLALNPEESGPHLILSRALLAGGRIEEAEERLRVAARMNPRDAESRSLLGLLLLRRGVRREGRSLLAEALDAAAGRVEAGRGAQFHGEGDTRATIAGVPSMGAGPLRAVAALAALGDLPAGVSDGGEAEPEVARRAIEVLRRSGRFEAALDLDDNGTTDAVVVSLGTEGLVVARRSDGGAVTLRIPYP